MDAGFGIPRIHRGSLKCGELFSSFQIPHDDVSGFVGCGQEAAIGGNRGAEQHRREMMGRLRLVALQFQLQTAIGGIPDAADHVICDADDLRFIRGDVDISNPLGMGVVQAAYLGVVGGVPPPQAFIVGSGDKLIATDDRAGDVALVLAERLPVRFVFVKCRAIDREVVTADEQGVRGVGFRNTQKDVLATDLVRDFQLIGLLARSGLMVMVC